MQRATEVAQQMDVAFLWECAPQTEFEFQAFAREYYGKAPDAVQSASVLLCLHGAPVYFHRKGRGRFRPAPPDILQAALAAVERKQQAQARCEHMIETLKAGALPAEIAEKGAALLLRPDKNSIEYKAIEQAAQLLQLSPLRLMVARGAVASAYRWHLDSFLYTIYAQGPGFSESLPHPTQAGTELEWAPVSAFSIDDSTTTEIDDAFSVSGLDDHSSTVRVGIHIAAPALAIERDDALDIIARTRLSTVYAPGIKITMLPETWINAYSLNAGAPAPVLSLYVDVDRGDLTVRNVHTCIERIHIAANLRHDRLDEVVTPEAIAQGQLNTEYGSELLFLHRWARALLAQRERTRGKPEDMNRIDYTFRIDADPQTDPFDIEHGHVDILPRQRGAPLDLIVSELMILANSHWAQWLAHQEVPAIYRTQRLDQGMGKVRMSTTPGPHEGMGVACYAWCTSPLRRFVDLVNQRQLIALVQGRAPIYARNDAQLFGIVSGFDAAYSLYSDFQNRMERYWCLRWLKQERIARIKAMVLKGDILRLAGMPFIIRIPGLADLPRGRHVELDILGIDDLDLTLEARVHQVLQPTLTDDFDMAEDEGLAPIVASSDVSPNGASMNTAASVGSGSMG